jgi:hypothetical protein
MLCLTRIIAIGIPLCITESELMSISCWGGMWLVATNHTPRSWLECAVIVHGGVYCGSRIVSRDEMGSPEKMNSGYLG